MAAVLPAGCTSAPGYRIRIERPHKDALQAEIRLPHRLPPSGYRAIAEHELGALRAALGEMDRPLYQIEFQFYVPHSSDAQELKAATFTWRQSSLDDSPAEPHAAALVLY